VKGTPTDDQFGDLWYHHLAGVLRWREDIDGKEVPVLLPSKKFDFRHNHYNSKVVRRMRLEKLRQLGEVMQWRIYEGKHQMEAFAKTFIFRQEAESWVESNSYSTLKLEIQGLEEYNGELLYTGEEVVTPTVFMNPLFKQFMKATAPELVKSKEQKLELMNGLFFQATVMCHENGSCCHKISSHHRFRPCSN
jgi:hypothetical protein